MKNRKVFATAATALLLGAPGTHLEPDHAQTKSPTPVLIRAPRVQYIAETPHQPAPTSFPDFDGKEFGPDQAAVSQSFNDDDPTPDTGLLVPPDDRKKVEKLFRDFSQTGGKCEVTVRQNYLPTRDDGVATSFDQTADTFGYLSPETGQPISFPAQQSSNLARCASLDKLYEFTLPMISFPFEQNDRHALRSPSVTLTLSNPSSVWDGDVPGTDMAVSLTCTRANKIEVNTITCRDAQIGPIPYVPSPLAQAPAALNP